MWMDDDDRDIERGFPEEKEEESSQNEIYEYELRRQPQYFANLNVGLGLGAIKTEDSKARNMETDTVSIVNRENEESWIKTSMMKRLRFEAHEEGKDLYLLKKAYILMKNNTNSAISWKEIENEIFLQKSPLGNTVLHIAAMCENDTWVDHITQSASHSHFLAAKNNNGDTPLHVAAKTGHISTLSKLLVASLDNLPIPYSEKPKEALDEILVRNKQGNTFFHVAILNGHVDVIKKIPDSQELEIEDGFKELIARAAFSWMNKEGKSVLTLAAEKRIGDIVDHGLTKLNCQRPALDMLIQNHQELVEMIPKPPLSLDDEESQKKLANLIPYGLHYVPHGESPLIAAILSLDQGIIKKILKEKKEWIHLRDSKGRNALHCAASIGYITGVEELLKVCISCNMERDNSGYFPLHLASANGEAEVVKILLEHCPDPKEIIDYFGRNIVHIAAQMGKFNVVRYILEDTNHGLVGMINDKDASGNTPLHLAASHFQPKIVHVLTWDERVDLSLVNRKNQTARDVFMQFPQENPPLRQLLTEIALLSAGIKYGKKGHALTILSLLLFCSILANKKPPK